MKKHRSAFTLLEIMLAVTILGLLVIAVSSTWSAGLRGWKRSYGLAEDFQRQRVVLESLADLMQSMVYWPDARSLYALRGEHDRFGSGSISFVTGSDALLPASEPMAGGLRRVTIAFERGADGAGALTIQSAPAMRETDRVEERPVSVIARDVTGFVIRYRHPQTGAWKEGWEEPTSLPTGVEFVIEFTKPGEKEPVIVSRMVDLPLAKLARAK